MGFLLKALLQSSDPVGPEIVQTGWDEGFDHERVFQMVRNLDISFWKDLIFFNVSSKNNSETAVSHRAFFAHVNCLP